MIQETRIRLLNNRSIQSGKFVVYWMQQSQREEYNHALEYAIIKANEFKQPLFVYFGITRNFPEANERHYYFMLEGLKDTESKLLKRGISMIVQVTSPEMGIIKLAKKASIVVTDCGYLKIQKKWRRYAASRMECPLIQVETDVIVPVGDASSKEEYSAGTLRTKLLNLLDFYMIPLRKNTVKFPSRGHNFPSFKIDNLAKAISKLNISNYVKKVDSLLGGTSQATRHLENFIKNKLKNYDELRNEPSLDYYSNMSPYLHFGHVSPLYIALKIKDNQSTGANAFLEQLIVRRELSMNYVNYNLDYDSFKGLPNWAKQTLLRHKYDPRDYIYSRKELETAQTHDSYWNAAQNEMILTGKMHGYMRMYWGKKILEWSKTPEYAYRTTLYLNNKYELDGRDANGFTGVAWCFGKHDRPWGERPVFGNIRYMNEKGLERKFDIKKYVEKINVLSQNY